MSFVYYNPNPLKRSAGDCVIRALCLLNGRDWETNYIALSHQGFMMCDMPSSNRVWESYLRQEGYRKRVLPDDCPSCYCVREFCNHHPYGKFLLALDGHVVGVLNGNYYDTWDSGDETPMYYWEKEQSYEPN